MTTLCSAVANTVCVTLYILLSYSTMETAEAMLVYNKFDEMAQLIKGLVFTYTIIAES